MSSLSSSVHGLNCATLLRELSQTPWSYPNILSLFCPLLHPNLVQPVFILFVEYSVSKAILWVENLNLSGVDYHSYFLHNLPESLVCIFAPQWIPLTCSQSHKSSITNLIIISLLFKIPQQLPI